MKRLDTLYAQVRNHFSPEDELITTSRRHVQGLGHVGVHPHHVWVAKAVALIQVTENVPLNLVPHLTLLHSVPWHKAGVGGRQASR